MPWSSYDSATRDAVEVGDQVGTLHTDICEQTKRQTQSPYPGRHRTSATPQPCNPHCVLHTKQVLTVTQLRTQIKDKAPCTHLHSHLPIWPAEAVLGTAPPPSCQIALYPRGGQGTLSSDLPWTSTPCHHRYTAAPRTPLIIATKPLLAPT